MKGKSYWMYAPTHVNVWSGRSIGALAAAAGLAVGRVYSGTEARLPAWLATLPRRTVRSTVREALLYPLRKVRLFGRGLGGL